MPFVLAVLSGKGGVGKTTSALALAAAFHERGLKTDLVDLDPQGGATWAAGLDPKAIKDGQGIASVLDGGSVERGRLRSVEGFGVFAASLALARFENDRRLPTMLMRLRTFPVDVVVVDCPPGIGLFPQSAATVADSIVVPLQPEPQAVYTLPQILALLTAVKARERFGGVVLTMVPPRASLTSPQRDEIAAIATIIAEVPRAIAVAESVNAMQSVLGYAPRSAAAEAYRTAAAALRPVTR